MYSLVLDILLAVLLVATIGYAIALNRKLGNLRRHKDELEKLASTFTESTTRAKDSIAGLKNSTAKLQADITKATGLKDDLKFLIDRGASIADRLESAVRESRGENKTSNRPGSVKPRQPVETIVDAMARAGAQSHERARPDRKNVATGVYSSSSLIGDTDDDAKSRAERDLIEALRLAR